MTELHIVRGGTPTESELAALVSVLTARANADEAPRDRPSLRTPLSPWVASGITGFVNRMGDPALPYGSQTG